MGIRCVVDNCRTFYSNPSKELQIKRNCYYLFPKDAKLRQMWFKKCGKKDPIDYDNSYVCSKHFKADDFERNLRGELLDLPIKRKLKPDAVPSLCMVINEIKEDNSTKNSGRKQRYEQRERKKVVEDDLQKDDSPQKNKPVKRSVEVNSTSSQINHRSSPALKKQKNVEKETAKETNQETQEKIDEIDAAELQKLLNIILERIQCLEQELEGLNHIMEDIKGRIEKMQNRH